MKKFAIMTPILFAPPNPIKVPGFSPEAAAGVLSFASFFSAYFGSASYNLGGSNCGKMLENMKKCYENNSTRPAEACSYYVDGFRRMACAKL